MHDRDDDVVIGVVDDDVVEASNLQRQVLHNTDRLGVDKAESARETIRALNPDVKVDVFAGRLDAANAMSLMAGYDVVVDGADNFPTRYLVNDAALHLRVPVVHGSIFRFGASAHISFSISASHPHSAFVSFGESQWS